MKKKERSFSILHYRRTAHLSPSLYLHNRWDDTKLWPIYKKICLPPKITSFFFSFRLRLFIHLRSPHGRPVFVSSPLLWICRITVGPSSTLTWNHTRAIALGLLRVVGSITRHWRAICETSAALTCYGFGPDRRSCSSRDLWISFSSYETEGLPCPKHTTPINISI